ACSCICATERWRSCAWPPTSACSEAQARRPRSLPPHFGEILLDVIVEDDLPLIAEDGQRDGPRIVEIDAHHRRHLGALEAQVLRLVVDMEAARPVAGPIDLAGVVSEFFVQLPLDAIADAVVVSL